MSNTRPAASFDASYTTYENMKPVKLPETLVDLRIEDFVMVELGGWGTLLKIQIKPGAEVKLKKNSDKHCYEYTIYVTPPKKAKTSIMTQETLTKNIKHVIASSAPELLEDKK